MGRTWEKLVSSRSSSSVEPRPATVLHVCDDLACRVGGAAALCDRLEATVGPEGTPTASGLATWTRSPCLGMCELAPAVLAQHAGRAEGDLAIEGEEGVHFERAWLDPESGKVFCLSTGPSKEAIMRIHERAGHPTEQVYELAVEV